MFKRAQVETLVSRLREPRRFIQALIGPRQVGKTTVARQAAATLAVPFHYVSADEPTLKGSVWLAQQWEIGRLRARAQEGAVLFLDEVHKVTGWAEAVKRLWDEDTASDCQLRVVVLGSAPLLVQDGLTETLAGRFEVIRVPHWSLSEMRGAFDFGLAPYLFFGGYPGAAPLVADEARWSAYVKDSLIETTVARDILLMTRVDKPALLRRLFELGCHYSGQILSYQKMLGQMQDAGNTTTLAHYLELLVGAGMLAGLSKFAGDIARQRGSSPKLQVFNTGLMAVFSGYTLASAQEDRDFWGRLMESAVGAYLLNGSETSGAEVWYWRDRNREVDFVVRLGRTLTAVEVKSGRQKGVLPGMQAFAATFKPQRSLLIGSEGIPIEEFLTAPFGQWFS